MIKFTNKFYGASLFALAFSLSAAEVSAQTCTAAPSCDTLGFTKSATDCSGRSTLKCPFDTTKLFCADEASSSTPTTPTETTYKAGDAYYHNGMYIGIVIKTTDKSIIVASTPIKDSSPSCSGSVTYCTNLSTAGALWYRPSTKYASLIANYTKKDYITCDSDYSTMDCQQCSSSICYSTFIDSSFYSCVTTFQK